MAEVKEILSSIPNYTSFITLTGLISQEDISIYLALSDILLSPHAPPNKNEPFFGSPTKLFEYMAMEKVIIASDLGQIADVLSPSVHIDKIHELTHSHLSILCDPGNVDHLKKAFKYAVNNLSKIKFMRYNARDKVIEKYTWANHVEEILSKMDPEVKCIL
jgi:glycosyltransferase involved in cell wall biosynthesis